MPFHLADKRLENHRDPGMDEEIGGQKDFGGLHQTS